MKDKNSFYIKPLLDVMATYFLIVTALIFLSSIDLTWFWWVLGFVVLSLLLHRLGLFLHAAVHSEFHSERNVSDRLYRIYLGWFFGSNLHAIRTVHLGHHRNFGKQERDPEDTYSTGLSFRQLVLMILKKDTPSQCVSEELAKLSHLKLDEYKMLSFASKIFQLIIVLILFYVGGVALASIYVASVLIGLPACVHLRNVLEHYSYGGDKTTTRSFHDGIAAFFWVQPALGCMQSIMTAHQ